MVFALDFAPISVGNTTVQMFIVLVLLTAIAAGLISLGTLAASPLVDRKWPADEPLDPTEMLWGESGSYIQRHFAGLELAESKQLATQFTEVKVPAGQFICEQGDPATHFFVLKEGEAEVVQLIQHGNLVREETIRRYGPGDSFGEVAIMRRTARTASIRALRDSVVLQLPAEDFVAGTALSAAEESELFARVDDYLAADQRRARSKETAELAFTRQAAGWRATHVVPATGLLAWDRPDPTAPSSTTLAAGIEVQKVEETGVWSRVVAANGWQGWVDGRTLVAKR